MNNQLKNIWETRKSTFITNFKSWHNKIKQSGDFGGTVEYVDRLEDFIYKDFIHFKSFIGTDISDDRKAENLHSELISYFNETEKQKKGKSQKNAPISFCNPRT